MLELKSVCKSYPSPVGIEPVKVLDEVNFIISSGESVAIVGPSGSGKSTLLNLLGSMDKPSSGEILFNGTNITNLKGDEESLFRAREVGFIFQDHRLLPQCTILENVLLPTLSLHKEAPADSVVKAKELIEKVGLIERIDHYPNEISGGECQRVAVVRSLINQPKIVLADEPTGALDQTNAHSLMKMLCDLSGDLDCAVAVVTHDPTMIQYTKRKVEIQNGKLIS